MPTHGGKKPNGLRPENKPQVSPLRCAPVETTKLWHPRLSLPQGTEAGCLATLSSRANDLADAGLREDTSQTSHPAATLGAPYLARFWRDVGNESALPCGPSRLCSFVPHRRPTGNQTGTAIFSSQDRSGETCGFASRRPKIHTRTSRWLSVSITRVK